MINLLSKIWRHLGKTIQWKILWFAHSKFNVGVSLIIPNTEGKVLLGKHVFSAEKNPWRLIGGFVSKGENIFDGAKREVMEELHIQIEPARILVIRTGFAHRVEFSIVTKPIGANTAFKIDPKELHEVAWFEPGSEPDNTLPYHKHILELYKNNPAEHIEIVNL